MLKISVHTIKHALDMLKMMADLAIFLSNIGQWLLGVFQNFKRNSSRMWF